ncbi:hypothetical protein BDV97DRAFT_368220 [Delphinella strobiligena]|nr:hypothetical protein BDV97DRAFT_368220 [Delphinella strobiligena]
MIYTLSYIRPRGSINVTHLGATCILVYISGNIIACVLRLGTIAIINFVPLYTGGSASVLERKILGLSFNNSRLAHHWIGRVCAVQALTHGALHMASTTWDFTIIETTTLCILIILLVSSFLFVRRRFYEVFVKSHYLLALALLVLLWFHLPFRKDIESTCLVITTVLWTTHTLLWLGAILWHNGILSRKYRYEIEHLESSSGTFGATRIRIKNGLWKISPGQYVYVRLRDLGPHYWYSIFESHPYMIAWIERDDAHAAERREIVLVAERRNGISDVLSLANGRRDSGGRLTVDGPYGSAAGLGKHDIAVYAASGVGLVAHLLSIKHLIRKYQSKESRVRRIFLVWVLEAESQKLWFIDWIHAILSTVDGAKIVDVMIYYDEGFMKNYSARKKSPEIERRERLWRVSGKFEVENARAYMRNAWMCDGGTMSVSVCGNSVFEHTIRTAVRTFRATASAEGLRKLGEPSNQNQKATPQKIGSEIYLYTSDFKVDDCYARGPQRGSAQV